MKQKRVPPAILSIKPIGRRQKNSESRNTKYLHKTKMQSYSIKFHCLNIINITLNKVPIVTRGMSIQTLTPINDDTRYDIKIGYHKENTFVVYEMRIIDLAFNKDQLLVFRFSEVKKFHDDLVKNKKITPDRFPEFPKTNSFGFWNKTNTSPRKIQDRKRELQYYFTKILNDPFIRGLRKVKSLLANVVKQRRRTRSVALSGVAEEKRSNKSHSLPKQKLYSFPRSMKEQRG